ncbi:MAG: fimbria/pilus outer membrane usher protein, partial [Sphingosinicella sp.]|uniref:fimbria/pilus outer membrane usher protein n=1 Tax=Sphingosinicella sp. TaxID=1917971 RepID=UPI004037CC1E
GPTRAVRLETSWTIDRPRNASTIRIGDSVSFGGLGAAPVRFAGVHYHRNYAVQPGFITMPLPSGTGSAAVPSVGDVYVNNVLQGSREVAPGPFELTGIPVQTGGGTVQLVVRDLLGREVISEQSYYASPQLLARGLHDFSYEAGFLRRRFGRRSNDYGAFMVSTTQRYGLSDRITGEAHAQASAERQMAGLGFTALAFDLSQVGGSVSVSRSDKGLGYRLAASFERQTRRLSFGLRADFASAHFGFLGMPDGWRPPRYTIQAFADFPVWRGSVGLQILHRAPRAGPSETFAGLSGSFQILPSASLGLFARQTIAGRRETSFGAHVTVALGGRRSAQAGFELSGGNSFYAGFQSDPSEATGGGYRAAVGLGKINRFEAAYAHNFAATSLLGEVAHVDGRTGLRLSATGSIGLVDGRAFASRSLGESFAIVRVEDQPGIRVYADDHLVGVTGGDGALIVPGLRAFDINRIRVDDADLPLDAQVESLETAIRPFARSGTAVRFSVRRERGVLMRVRREDGSALPAGARVRVGQEAATYVVVGQGEIYVPGLTGTALLRARWGDRSCAFRVDVPPSDDPQPRLDGLICREESRYAAN